MAFFGTLIVAGLFLQNFLAVRCRCYWGTYTSHMIDGALVVDIWVLGRLLLAAVRKAFLPQCLIGAMIVASSPFWIPVIFKIVLAAWLLPHGEPLSNLFHSE